MIKKTARVIMTFNCPRHCKYCVNQYSNIISKAIKIHDISVVHDFDEVCITGGEPMLYPQIVFTLLKKLKPHQKKFLYSAWFVPAIFDIIPLLDGLHFTLHENSSQEDIHNFYKLQTVITNSNWYKTKSFRLYIHRNNDCIINIVPFIWTRLEVKPWQKEVDCSLPENETLFILE